MVNHNLGEDFLLFFLVYMPIKRFYASFFFKGLMPRSRNHFVSARTKLFPLLLRPVVVHENKNFLLVFFYIKLRMLVAVALTVGV